MSHHHHGGSHGGNMDMAAAPVCKLHMLWNNQIKDTCIVFRSWHISSTTAFVASCLAIVALCVFHEWLRVLQKRVDYRIALSLQNSAAALGAGAGRRSPSRSRGSSPGSNGQEENGLLSGTRKLFTPANSSGVPVPTFSRILRASIYGATIFISFFLMLVFMTYNSYLIASVVVGASLGHYIFGASINPDAILHDSNQDKGMACH